MLNTTLKCLMISLLVAAAPASAQEKPKTSEPQAFEIYRLDNGMDLVTMESHKVPLVTIVLVAKAGGMTETADIDGLTHLWEHMFFKGNKRIPNQEAFKQKIRQLGIQYNGDTSAEKVRYYFTMPSALLEEGLQFMADAISTPLLDQKELEKERIVVMDEYDRAASNPGFNLNRIQQKLIYGKNSHRRDPLGQRSIIEKATREQLYRIKEEVFVPGNSALVISGDFEVKKVRELVKKYFTDWKNPKDWKPLAPVKFQKFPDTTEIVYTHPHAQNVDITISFEGPKARSQPDDSYAADILISLLQNRTSKFYKKFVDSGLSLNAGLSYYTQSQAATVDLYASAVPQKAKEVKEALLKEVELWAKPGYFTDDQLADVRRTLEIDYKRELNKPSAYAKTLAFWWAVTGLDYYAGYLPALQRTNFSAIQAFVKKYLVGKNHVTSILLSPEAAKQGGFKDNSEPYLKKFDLAQSARAEEKK